MTIDDSMKPVAQAHGSSPFLVGGEIGSGSEVLAIALDAHPDVFMASPLDFQGPRDLGPGVLGAVRRPSSSRLLDQFKRIMRGPGDPATLRFCTQMLDLGITIEELESAVADVVASRQSDVSTFEDRCQLLQIIMAGRGPRWGIDIGRDIQVIDRYRSVWPDLQVIHVVRDGRDVVASRLSESQESSSEQAVEFARDWSGLVQRTAKALDPAWSRVVRFEDLMGNPDGSLRDLLGFLGLAWFDGVRERLEGARGCPGFPGGLGVGSNFGDEGRAGGIGVRGPKVPLEVTVEIERSAAKELEALGYQDRDHELTVVDMELGRESCAGDSACERMVQKARASLCQKYIGLGARFPGQVRSAVLDLRGLDYQEYRNRLKRLSKGSALRQAAKSDREGFQCRRFVRGMHLPDIVDINHSKTHRSGGAMRAAYLKSLEEMGGAPTRVEQPADPTCSIHHDTWWGVFQPSPGYRQGEIVTDERLIAYVDCRRLGSFAFYSLILGHGAFLRYGIMYRLHLAIMESLCERSSAATRGIDFLMYSGMDFGGDGMMQWKRKTGFRPAALVMRESPAGT